MKYFQHPDWQWMLMGWQHLPHSLANFRLRWRSRPAMQRVCSSNSSFSFRSTPHLIKTIIFIAGQYSKKIDLSSKKKL
jgi:hypothetical protein